MHRIYSPGRDKSFYALIKKGFYNPLKAPSPVLIYFLCGLYKLSEEEKEHTLDDQSLSGNCLKYQFTKGSVV